MKADNSKNKKARVVILERELSSHPVLYFYQISLKYSKGIQVYRRDKKFYADTEDDANGIQAKNNMSPHPSVGGWGGGGIILKFPTPVYITFFAFLGQ